jgi:hypothetical protein
VAVCFEHGNVSSGSVKFREFFWLAEALLVSKEVLDKRGLAILHGFMLNFWRTHCYEIFLAVLLLTLRSSCKLLVVPE